MVSITLEGLWMVSDRIVNFRLFVKFHRSGPAIIFSFLNYLGACYLWIKKGSQSSQDLSGPHQDGQYSSGRIMEFFLIELSIFNFSSNFTGPDLQ